MDQMVYYYKFIYFKGLAMLARLESIYSMNEDNAEELEKLSGCLLLIRWAIS